MPGERRHRILSETAGSAEVERSQQRARLHGKETGRGAGTTHPEDTLLL